MMDAVVQLEGTIYGNGYGFIARLVMRDPTLKHQSKSIYAYICSFASSKNSAERSAFPKVSLQVAELGMSEETYYKYRKPLVDKGYLKIEKFRTEDGKFERNLYTIVAVGAFEPYPKISGMDKKPPYPESPCMAQPSTANPSTANSGTKSKSIKSKSIKTNNIKNDDDEEAPFEINKSAFRELINNFEEQFPGKFDDPFWDRIYQQMIIQKVSIITFIEGFNQMKYMQVREAQGEIIGDYAAYFVGGIVRKRTSEVSALRQRKLAKAEKRKQEPDEQPPVPFYDWREE